MSDEIGHTGETIAEGDQAQRNAARLIGVVEDSRFQCDLLCSIIDEIDDCRSVALPTLDTSVTETLLGLQVDLLIVDYMLPEPMGVDIVRAIRAHPQLSALPILMLTGSGSQSLYCDALTAGVTAFETKPIDPATLKRKVRMILDRSSRPTKGKRVRVYQQISPYNPGCLVE